jgi:hypothetical protein
MRAIATRLATKLPAVLFDSTKSNRLPAIRALPHGFNSF